MIVVTGATGNVGGEVVTALSARGQQVRAVVRDPERASLPAGVEVVRGDLELPESLTSSLAGARAGSQPVGLTLVVSAEAIA